MEWIPFEETTCPIGEQMIFLTDKGHWFEGIYCNDSEYGYCISLYERYRNTEGITHYLIPQPL